MDSNNLNAHHDEQEVVEVKGFSSAQSESVSPDPSPVSEPNTDIIAPVPVDSGKANAAFPAFKETEGIVPVLDSIGTHCAEHSAVVPIDSDAFLSSLKDAFKEHFPAPSYLTQDVRVRKFSKKGFINPKAEGKVKVVDADSAIKNFILSSTLGNSLSDFSAITHIYLFSTLNNQYSRVMLRKNQLQVINSLIHDVRRSSLNVEAAHKASKIIAEGLNTISLESTDDVVTLITDDVFDGLFQSLSSGGKNLKCAKLVEELTKNDFTNVITTSWLELSVKEKRDLRFENLKDVLLTLFKISSLTPAQKEKISLDRASSVSGKLADVSVDQLSWIVSTLTTTRQGVNPNLWAKFVSDIHMNYRTAVTMNGSLGEVYRYISFDEDVQLEAALAIVLSAYFNVDSDSDLMTIRGISPNFLSIVNSRLKRSLSEVAGVGDKGDGPVATGCELAKASSKAVAKRMLQTFGFLHDTLADYTNACASVSSLTEIVSTDNDADMLNALNKQYVGLIHQLQACTKDEALNVVKEFPKSDAWQASFAGCVFNMSKMDLDLVDTDVITTEQVVSTLTSLYGSEMEVTASSVLPHLNMSEHWKDYLGAHVDVDFPLDVSFVNHDYDESLDALTDAGILLDHRQLNIDLISKYFRTNLAVSMLCSKSTLQDVRYGALAGTLCPITSLSREVMGVAGELLRSIESAILVHHRLYYKTMMIPAVGVANTICSSALGVRALSESLCRDISPEVKRSWTDFEDIKHLPGVCTSTANIHVLDIDKFSCKAQAMVRGIRRGMLPNESVMYNVSLSIRDVLPAVYDIGRDSATLQDTSDPDLLSFSIISKAIGSLGSRGGVVGVKKLNSLQLANTVYTAVKKEIAHPLLTKTLGMFFVRHGEYVDDDASAEPCRVSDQLLTKIANIGSSFMHRMLCQETKLSLDTRAMRKLVAFHRLEQLFSLAACIPSATTAVGKYFKDYELVTITCLSREMMLENVLEGLGVSPNMRIYFNDDFIWSDFVRLLGGSAVFAPVSEEMREGSYPIKSLLKLRSRWQTGPANAPTTVSLYRLRQGINRIATDSDLRLQYSGQTMVMTLGERAELLQLGSVLDNAVQGYNALSTLSVCIEGIIRHNDVEYGFLTERDFLITVCTALINSL